MDPRKSRGSSQDGNPVQLGPWLLFCCFCQAVLGALPAPLAPILLYLSAALVPSTTILLASNWRRPSLPGKQTLPATEARQTGGDANGEAADTATQSALGLLNQLANSVTLSTHVQQSSSAPAQAGKSGTTSDPPSCCCTTNITTSSSSALAMGPSLNLWGTLSCSTSSRLSSGFSSQHSGSQEEVEQGHPQLADMTVSPASIAQDSEQPSCTAETEQQQQHLARSLSAPAAAAGSCRDNAWLQDTSMPARDALSTLSQHSSSTA